MSESKRYFRVFSYLRKNKTVSLLVLFCLLVAFCVGVYFYFQRKLTFIESEIQNYHPHSARREAEGLLKYYSGHGKLNFLAARACRNLGDLQGCERYLARYKEIQGQVDQQYQIENMLLRSQSGDIDKVSDALFYLVEKEQHPDSEQILSTLSLVYLNQLRLTPADACLNLWLQRYPNAYMAYHRRGWVAERFSQMKSAISDYQKALEINPELFLTRLRLAELLIDDKQPIEARPHIDYLIKYHPNNNEVKARIGMCCYLEGKNEESRKWLESAENELSEDPLISLYLARLDVQEAKGEAAEKRCRHCLKLDKSDSDAWFLLTTALRLQGKDADAEVATREHRKYLERNTRINDLLKTQADTANGGVAVWLEIAEILTELGQEKRSVLWLEKCLERDPKNQKAIKMMADYHEKNKDTEKSEFFRKVLKSLNGE